MEWAKNPSRVEEREGDMPEAKSKYCAAKHRIGNPKVELWKHTEETSNAKEIVCAARVILPVPKCNRLVEAVYDDQAWEILVKSDRLISIPGKTEESVDINLAGKKDRHPGTKLGIDNHVSSAFDDP